MKVEVVVLEDEGKVGCDVFEWWSNTWGWVVMSVVRVPTGTSVFNCRKWISVMPHSTLWKPPIGSYPYA